MKIGGIHIGGLFDGWFGVIEQEMTVIASGFESVYSRMFSATSR